MNTTLNTEQPESFSAALTADLLAGKYSPGEWLKQSDLEANYNANRFEVRIARTPGSTDLWNQFCRDHRGLQCAASKSEARQH